MSSGTKGTHNELGYVIDYYENNKSMQMTPEQQHIRMLLKLVSGRI